MVTGRVADASLVVGPTAARFGWERADYDSLAAPPLPDPQAKALGEWLRRVIEVPEQLL